MQISKFCPIGKEVAYTTGETLFNTQQGDAVKVADEIQTFGQYGSQLVYANKESSVYLWQDGESIFLPRLTDDCIRGLIGNGKYLAIISFDGSYVYQEDMGLYEVEIPLSSEQAYFLYGNSLVVIGIGEAAALPLILRIISVIRSILDGSTVNLLILATLPLAAMEDSAISLITQRFFRILQKMNVFIPLHCDLIPKIGVQRLSAKITILP